MRLKPSDLRNVWFEMHRLSDDTWFRVCTQVEYDVVMPPVSNGIYNRVYSDIQTYVKWQVNGVPVGGDVK